LIRSLGRLGLRTKLVLVSALLLVFAGLVVERLSTGQIEAALMARIQSELLTKAALIEDEVHLHGERPADPGWDALADTAAQRAELRVTLLAEDGRVLGDSGVAEASLGVVDNHADRPEFQEALAGGRGVATRSSTTVGRRLLYVARKVEPPSPVAVVRLALPLDELDAALAQAQRILWGGIGLALLITTLMIALATGLLTSSVRQVTATALAMARGDLKARAPVRGEDEAGQLARTLNRLAGELETSLGELRGERDLLSGILDGMSEGVLVVDAEGSILLANRALRAMTLGGEGMVGRSVLEVVRNASLQEALEDARRGPVSREIELGGLLPRKLLLRASPLTGDMARHRIAVLHDVTELRHLETVRTDFVANVSHELRTPVTAITMAVETLLDGALREPDMAEEFLQVVERHARRMREIIDDLLDLARFESKSFRLNVAPASAGIIAQQTAALFAQRAEKRGSTIVVRPAEELPPALLDRRAFEQVLSNLLDNALKYAGEGAHIDVTLRREGRELVATVADDGPGIPEAHLGRIFERFYRVDAGRSRDVGGTGLGLSIIKHLVELMQGTISASSLLGEGTCFTVRLPLAPGAPSPRPSAPRQAENITASSRRHEDVAEKTRASTRLES
jgi:two-component system phosphate regulon sensor histidine kinase PhoR